MNEILYKSLIKYFKALSILGYKDYESVYKILLIKFIQELMTSELQFFVTEDDIKLMTNLLYQLFGSTCEISFPTNCAVICGGTAPVVTNPSINTFTITPATYTTVYPNTSVTINTINATLGITAGSNLNSSSLKIKYNGNIIYTGTAASGDITINLTNALTITAASGTSTSITLTAEIADTDGNLYTKDSTITLNSGAQTSGNNVYYGSTNIAPTTFQNTAIADIFALNPTSQAITGTDNVEFIIHQTDIIHYLLVPTNLVSLVHAEYGTALITTLWDGTTGSYFTTNKGGTYNNVAYSVYFNYNPSGAFSEDIRITCKNK